MSIAGESRGAVISTQHRRCIVLRKSAGRRNRLHSETHVDPLRYNGAVYYLNNEKPSNGIAARRGRERFAANVIDIPSGRLALR